MSEGTMAKEFKYQDYTMDVEHILEFAMLYCKVVQVKVNIMSLTPSSHNI